MCALGGSQKREETPTGEGKVAELSTDGRRTHFRVFCLRARRRQSKAVHIRLYRIDKGDAFPIPKRLCKAPSDIVLWTAVNLKQDISLCAVTHTAMCPR